MKVLQINCVYQKGSTGKIVYDIHSELQKQGISSVVCYGRGEKTDKPNVYKTCGELYSKLNNLRSRFTGLMYGGCGLSTRRLISVIKREKPDVVHLHCINGYFVNIYRLISWLKKQRIKTVLTLHAEFLYTANCAHALDCERWKTGCGCCPRLRRETKSLLLDRTHRSWSKMYAAFDGFDTLTVASVSPWLRVRAERSPMLSYKRHTVIFNGVNTAVFYPREKEELRKRLGIGTKRVVFHVTAAFSDAPEHLKGGYYVLELAKRMKQDNVIFLVAGKCVSALQPPENVLLLGNLSNQEELANLYSLADVTLLTSKRETFSMPLAESLCCGTPVAGFCAGGPESIALREYCAFTPYGDLCALEQSVQAYLQEAPARDVMAEKAQSIYRKEQMCKAYVELYRELCKG